MTSKRRQSTSYGEELFEFVDYTSVSNFERLVTAIEEVLLSWRIKNNSYGVFSDEVLKMAIDAVPSTSLEYSRHESISVGEETYKLTYHCHPYTAAIDSSSTQPFLLDNYYTFDNPLTSGETTTRTTFHPLHRWTGLGRFFILAPVSDSLKSKLFASSKVSVDIYQAKLLLSACSIAFNNVQCPVPVFISVGQARYNNYTGYMLHYDGKKDLEIRFNTSVISFPLHCHMAGLQDLFIQNLNANRFDNGLPPISPLEKLSICKGAVFTYSLKNWYNENWKQWDDDDEANESTFASLKTKSTQMDDWNDGFIRSLNSADSVLLPPLPFGPYNDPLRTMTLSAVFPLADDGTGNYTDDAIHSNMDALTANFWELSREFAPSTQQRSFLSTLLDQAITSWIKDPSNRDYLAPYDSNNNNSLNGESVGRDNSTGLVRNLLHAMSQNRTGSITQQGNQITVIKSDQVETIINALFRTNMDDGNKNKKSDSNTDHIKLRNANSDITLYTSGALGLRLKYGASVPKQSFLWNMVTFELHALQEMNKGGYSTSTSSSSSSSSSSFMGFLRILWIEVVRQIRWHWENLIPIPHVDPFLYRPSLSTDSDDTLKKDSQHNGTLGIDLNYNILHQKLAMINCCIHQSIKTLPMEEDSSSVPTSGKKISTLFDKVHDSRMTSNNNSKNEKKLGTMDRFNNFLEQLVDGDNDVSTETKDKMTSDVNSDMSESELFFDSIDDIEKATVLDAPSTSVKQNQPSSSSSSCGSSLSDVSELAHPTSMQESFVRLNYSASAESDPCQHVPSHLGDIEDWSTGLNRESEIQDPNAFEGRSYQHESIKLLKTDTPLWVPITQNPGFMTEDMIQQQADVFESLGTSDDATQLRAKLQSAQLLSDMQAFKAANPYAVLEDFVRWHSPKDWIESPGCLSARMSEPTNIWQELWKCSRRIPVSRQKSLFNLTAEGEKALHYLESLSVHDVFSLLLPTMGLIMYDTLASQPIVKYIRPVALGLNELATALMNYPWDALKNGKCTFDGLISKIKKEESSICNSISLLRKFPRQYDLVERLVVNPRTRIKEGDERAAVFNLYKNEYNMISKPSYKEYVFYINSSSSIETPLPQRQYVLVKDNELRMVDMYSTDGRYC